MKILFLDQSGKLGGAELSLLDVTKPYGDRALVGLFADGVFREALEQQQTPVLVLNNQSIEIRKESNLIQSLTRLGSLLPLVQRVAQIARNYDVIYANTQKALVVGAIASFLTHRPLVYHLRDILSQEHFSKTNLRIAITLANQFAALVIANSQATRKAFIDAGGRADKIKVVYNGFEPCRYQISEENRQQVRQELGVADKFIVGHFSRLSPWKGQHILIEALTHCPENVAAMLVGDALFGETEYVESLHQQVEQLKLKERVQFLGFQNNVIPLMFACDLVAHTSTAPEPFGRVIVEAMLCEKLVVASEAGGAIELIEPGVTGFLVSPGEPEKLAKVITQCQQQPELRKAIASQAKQQASQRFLLENTNQQIAHLLNNLIVRSV